MAIPAALEAVWPLLAADEPTGEVQVLERRRKVRRSILKILSVLLVLPLVVGCGDDAEPTSPAVRLSTEVTVAPDTIPQGVGVSGLATFSVVSGGDVEISFDQSIIIGYRVTSVGGELMMEFPSDEYGLPTDFVVRPGWDMKVIVNTPSTRTQAEEPYRFVTWHSEAEAMPAGEYVLEAGLYGLESQYPWDKATFVVSGAVAN